MKKSLLALTFILAAAHSDSGVAAELEVFKNRLFLEATVNGRPVTALLDPGAEMTILDDDFAARLKLQVTGEADAKGSGAASVRAGFAKEVELAAAGVSLPRRTVGVLDLSDISGRLVGRPVELILGRDLFDEARLQIDIPRGRLSTVSRRGKPRGVRLDLLTHRGIETFPAIVEGHPPAQAVFDLGNGGEVMVGKAYAEKLGLTKPGRITGRSSGGGVGGRVTRDMVVLKSLTLAGRTFHDVPAAIDASESAADLNIGTSILRNFRITADFQQKAIWLAPPR
jgi:predicted aspartyl protease